MPKTTSSKEPKNLVTLGVDIYFKVSLLCPHGVWVGQVKQFQYDMTVDALQFTKRQAKKEFLKKALEYYNEHDSPKKEYLSWLLKIQ